MSCSTLVLPDGGIAILCSGGGAPKKCGAANCTKDSVALCDWKLHIVDGGGKRRYTGKRCSMALCPDHCRAVGPEKDLCPVHHERALREGILPGNVAQKANA